VLGNFGRLLLSFPGLHPFPLLLVRDRGAFAFFFSFSVLLPIPNFPLEVKWDDWPRPALPRRPNRVLIPFVRFEGVLLFFSFFRLLTPLGVSWASGLFLSSAFSFPPLFPGKKQFPLWLPYLVCCFVTRLFLLPRLRGGGGHLHLLSYVFVFCLMSFFRLSPPPRSLWFSSFRLSNPHSFGVCLPSFFFPLRLSPNSFERERFPGVVLVVSPFNPPSSKFHSSSPALPFFWWNLGLATLST